jgi:hypothetical protein
MRSVSESVHHHLREHAKKTRHDGKAEQPVNGTACLTYYIFEGVLVGFIERDLIHITAWSRGAGGSKSHEPNATANNPYMYALKLADNKKKHIHKHGGPIPPGRYRIHAPGPHGHFKLCAVLEPLQKLPNERGGFLIHGRGPHGSDGCIVPMNDDDFPKLMEKLKVSKGGLLHVCESMDGAFA